LNTPTRPYRERAATRIFKNGSVKVDLIKGFRLAIHDDLPDAPPSPFYLNLRREGVKGGVLNNEDFAWIGLSLHKLCRDHDLLTVNRPVCSIPAAGDPFLDALMRIKEKTQVRNLTPTRFSLIKDESTGKRQFNLADTDNRPHLNSLLVDDLVASMLTKWLAINAIRQARGTVTDLLVFLNRSADAKERLAAHGINLHAVWELADLMQWALEDKHLTLNQFDAIMAYPVELAAYKLSVGYDK
jgi:orotate phosphoribosyltransferase